MKYQTAVIALLWLLSSASTAETGNELQRDCARDPKFCLGYITGVSDAYSAWAVADQANQAMYKRKHGEALSERYWIKPRRYCLPNSATPEQAKQAVLKYLADHPAELSYDADELIGAALEAAFPCRE
jgi:hypothetical protein